MLAVQLVAAMPGTLKLDLALHNGFLNHVSVRKLGSCSSVPCSSLDALRMPIYHACKVFRNC